MLGVAALGAVSLASCGPRAPRPGLVSVDGSSTVYPLTEAVAEEYGREHPGARVAVGIVGTGGGLRRLCRGGLDVADASRPITPAEHDACLSAGVRYVELPVAYDGVTVVVHPSNTFVESLTVEQLGRLWRHEAEGRVLRWSDWRPDWPDREMRLFGAGVDSGTFDYFTAVVTGTPGDSRGDYTSSESDHLLVQGVAGDPDAIGYFGYAYYEQHATALRPVPIRATADAPAVPPTRESIRSGRYRPLARPVFVYVNARALTRPEVHAFVDYYLSHVSDLAGEVGYVPLAPAVMDAVRARLRAGHTGSLFASGTASQTLAARLGLE